MALTMNQESTNEMASPKNFILYIKSKDFTRHWAQVNRSINRNHNLFDKINKFDFI